MGLVEAFVQTLVTPISTQQASLGISSIPILNMPITYVVLFAVGGCLWASNVYHALRSKNEKLNN